MRRRALKVSEIAKIVGLSNPHVRRLAAAGKIPETIATNGGHFRFRDTPCLRQWAERLRAKRDRMAAARAVNAPASKQAATLPPGPVSFYARVEASLIKPGAPAPQKPDYCSDSLARAGRQNELVDLAKAEFVVGAKKRLNSAWKMGRDLNAARAQLKREDWTEFLIKTGMSIRLARETMRLAKHFTCEEPGGPSTLTARARDALIRLERAQARKKHQPH